MLKTNEKGQSLIEVLVVGVVSAIMVIALIMIILNSLKNAQFAQNQTQATKLAQDTVDKIRIMRDNNANGTLTKISNSISACFNELWNNLNTDFDCGGTGSTNFCYYELINSPLSLNYFGNSDIPLTKINLSGGFSRQIKVNHDITQLSLDEVKVIVIINWNDSSGVHNSQLETVITKPNYDCVI